MLDKISGTMMSLVTTYFESCGDSLESVFSEDPYSKAARTSSRVKVKEPKKSLSSANEPPGGCFYCGTVSGLSPLHEPMMENEATRPLMELQSFDGSDMVFFPAPSSEVVAFYGKNDPHFQGLSAPLDSPKNRPIHESPVSIETYRDPLAAAAMERLSEGSPKLPSPRYQTGSPSPEVATKWIAMGATSSSKENRNSKSRRSSRHPWNQDREKLKSYFRLVGQDVPFDEETPSAPLTSTRSHGYRKQNQRPPPVPRRLPLASTTDNVATSCELEESEVMIEKDTTKRLGERKNDPGTSPEVFIPNPSLFQDATGTTAITTTSKTAALPPFLPRSFDEEEAPCTPTKASATKPGFFQRLQLARKTTYRTEILSGDSINGSNGCHKEGLLYHHYQQQQHHEYTRRLDQTPFFLDNIPPEDSTGASKVAIIMPKEKSHPSSSSASSDEKTSHWKSAVDPRTGRTYYYHEITRETQWRKPMELATDEEKRAMEEKERKQKDFFAAMEANILNSISQGVVPGTPVIGGDSSGISSNFGRRISSRKVSVGPDARPELVRTISTMDEDILMDVIRRQPSFRDFKPSREDSLQPNDLLGSRRRSSEVRDGFETWSQGSHSQNQPLETLQERFNESTDSLPALFNFVSDEKGEAHYDEEESTSHPLYGGDLNESSLTGFGLTWEETQALKKLASITKEMIDAERDVLMFEESPPSKNNTSPSAGTTPSWKPKDDKEKRDLPRELDFDESDEEDDDPDTPKQLPALSKARQGSDGRALPREIEFSSDEEEESAHTPTPIQSKTGRSLQKAGKKENGQARPEVKRRNTCGTMYIGTTMSAPDKDATIRCVCGVVRSHILSSEHDTRYNPETDPYKLFNDQESERGRHKFEFSSKVKTKANPPSLEEVATFYRDIFFKAQMEADCIIMSLIYVERLIKKTAGRLRPRAGNWRSLLFSCMILSSKVWDDLSMWNVDFSQSCPPGVSFSLKRINELELAVLNALSFKVKVPASEYAKYYFLLRSMLIKSGLAGDDLSALNPLDVQGARKLQQVSSQFEDLSLTQGDPLGPNQRSKSLNPRSIHKAALEYSTKPKLGLEQVVKM